MSVSWTCCSATTGAGLYSVGSWAICSAKTSTTSVPCLPSNMRLDSQISSVRSYLISKTPTRVSRVSTKIQEHVSEATMQANVTDLLAVRAMCRLLLRRKGFGRCSTATGAQLICSTCPSSPSARQKWIHRHLPLQRHLRLLLLIRLRRSRTHPCVKVQYKVSRRQKHAAPRRSLSDAVPCIYCG